MKYLPTALALAALALTPLSRAQVIFENIANSNPYNAGSGWTLGLPPTNQEAAMPFIAGSSLFLDFADLRIWYVSGSTTVNVALLADSGANTPGAVLETTTAISQAGPGLRQISHAEFSNTLFLTAGTMYWLAVSPSDGSSHSAWDYTGVPTGLRALDQGQLGFSDAWGSISAVSDVSAMRIFGVAGASAVPEPSTYGLIGGRFARAGGGSAVAAEKVKSSGRRVGGGGQRTADRGQMSDVGCQTSDVGCRMSAFGVPKIER